MDRKTYGIETKSVTTRQPFDVEDRISWDEITPSLKEKFKRYSQGMDIQLSGDVIGEACNNTLKYIRYYDIGGNIWIEDDANKIIKEFEIHFTTQSVIEMSAAVTMTVIYEYRYDNFTINFGVHKDPVVYHYSYIHLWDIDTNPWSFSPQTVTKELHIFEMYWHYHGHTTGSMQVEITCNGTAIFVMHFPLKNAYVDESVSIDPNTCIAPAGSQLTVTFRNISNNNFEDVSFHIRGYEY